MMNWRASRAVVASVLVTSLGSPAVAATQHDARAASALYRRALDLSQALTDAVGVGVSQANASGDAQALDCLDTLREAVGEISDQLMDVQDVATLSVGLRRGADRRAGRTATRKSAARALAVLPAEARQINQTASLCATQTAVQQRARDGLQLIDDATPVLQRLRAR